MSKASEKAERKLSDSSDSKLNANNEPTKNYISFFQSVTTVGIVSSGKDAQEAQEKSELKMKNSDMAYSVITHDPFTVSGTDEWLEEIQA